MPRGPPSIFSPPRSTATGTTPSGHDSPQTDAVVRAQALKADALDFLGDTVTYGLSLAVIGASLRTRASAALLKGASLSVMAAWVFGSTVYQTLILGLPKAEVMGGIGVLVLAANAASVLLFLPYKG